MTLEMPTVWRLPGDECGIFCILQTTGTGDSTKKRSMLMKTIDINQYLRDHAYPGRGILLGRSADNKSAVIAYFIMGRSANSRNRIFTPCGRGQGHHDRGL